MNLVMGDVVEVVSSARSGVLGVVIGEAERQDDDRMFIVSLATGETLTMPEWALRRAAPKRAARKVKP